MNSEDYNVKDISLADWGRKEIEIAEVEMPGLMASREEYGPQQFQLVQELVTAVLIETLYALGAKVRWCSCNIFSTQDQAAAAIVKAGTASIFAYKGMSLDEYWEFTLRALDWGNGVGPNLLVDDGGDMTMLLLEGQKWENIWEEEKRLPDPTRVEAEDEQALFRFLSAEIPKHPHRFRNYVSQIKGVSEETTTGVLRLNQLATKNQLLFPAINVNDSVTKTKFDNIYGCRHSLPDGIFRATDVMLAGKKVLIAGYGDVGKGCAQAMKGCGSRVYITEIDPICALQALMEGFEVVRIDKYIKDIDVFITSTGNKGIVLAQHMSQMKHNAIVGNIGHLDNEIDMKGLKEWPGIQRTNIKPQVDKWTFPDGHSIIILKLDRQTQVVPLDIHHLSCLLVSQTKLWLKLNYGSTKIMENMRIKFINFQRNQMKRQLDCIQRTRYNCTSICRNKNLEFTIFYNFILNHENRKQRQQYKIQTKIS